MPARLHAGYVSIDLEGTVTEGMNQEGLTVSGHTLRQSRYAIVSQSHRCMGSSSFLRVARPHCPIACCSYQAPSTNLTSVCWADFVGYVLGSFASIAEVSPHHRCHLPWPWTASAASPLQNVLKTFLPGRACAAENACCRTQRLCQVAFRFRAVSHPSHHPSLQQSINQSSKQSICRSIHPSNHASIRASIHYRFIHSGHLPTD